MMNTIGINLSAITSWQNSLTQPTARQTQKEDQNTQSTVTQRNTSDSAPVISQTRSRSVDVLTSLQATVLSTRMASALGQQPTSIASDAPALRGAAENAPSITGYNSSTDKPLPQNEIDDINSFPDELRDFLGPAPVYHGGLSSDGRGMDELGKDILQDKLDKMSGYPVVDLTGNGE